MSEALGLCIHHGQCRDAVQHGLNGAKDAIQAVFAGGLMAQFLQLFQRNHVRFGKWPDRDPAQHDHMAKAAEGPAQVTGERAHIGALAAGHLKGGL